LTKIIAMPGSVYRRVLLMLLSFFMLCHAEAQLPSLFKKDTGAAKIDTAGKGLPPAEVIGALSQSDTSMATLLSKIEGYSLQASRDQSFLKKEFDTTEISNEVRQVHGLLERWKQNRQDDANAVSIRNLNSTEVALQQVAILLGKREAELTAHVSDLVRISADVNKARKDSALRSIPRDTLLLDSYLGKLNPLQTKWRWIDSALQVQLTSYGMLQNEMATVKYEIDELYTDIQDRIGEYQKKFFDRDVNPVWEPSQLRNPESLYRVVSSGLIKNMGLSMLFIISNGWPILLCLLLCVGLFVLNRFNTKKLRAMGGSEALEKLHFTRRSNLLSCLLIFFMISPFLLHNPPAGMVQVFWICVTFTAIMLRRPDWPSGYSKLAIIFLLFFVLFSLDSFILNPNDAERRLLIFLNIAAVIFGWFFYKEVLRDKTRFHSLMDESILIFMVINVLALLANMTGRLNLARVLSNSSALSISLLLALQIIREVILEPLYLHAETHKNTGFAGFLDFDSKNQKYRKFLGVVTIILWLLSFAWSMSFYDRIYDWVGNFLLKERSLGEFKFAYGSILIFIVIIWVAVIAERIIGLIFKAEDPNFPGRHKTKSGSWVLFSKLAIYVIGFLLAMAAAGIPMDKFAIVLGALGVGIGLGLQNIVNNLVSGIILAVEKPMEVGDVIELGTRMGTVREIGFRSSQIATYDGSVIIVPNGDFISQQLINWTHSNNNYRRVDIVVGIPYGSDLEKVKAMVLHIVKNNPEVAPFPEPLVLVHEFATSSVNVRCLFWTAEFDKWVGLKSNVLQEIYDAFKREGIEIPFPQTDLHIRSIDPTVAERLRKG
jgi:potassium-dependent mechanosensitive channel